MAVIEVFLVSLRLGLISFGGTIAHLLFPHLPGHANSSFISPRIPFITLIFEFACPGRWGRAADEDGNIQNLFASLKHETPPIAALAV